jgi:cytochrome c biogenesis protein CcdA/thiol-disulfide isomerase/thioredoxin
MTLPLIAFLAGMFSVLTPCILPVLPALLVVSDGQGRKRVFGVVIGVVVSFCIAILALTAIVDAFGISPDVLRYVSATILLIFGLVLLVPALDERFQMAAQSVVRLAPTQNQGDGFIPGMLAGATLGLVWAPCAGPILAGITSSIATEGIGRDAIVATVAYGLGMMIPLTAVAFGGRALVGRLRKVLDNGRRVNQIMGIILVATSLLFFSGWDTKLNRQIAETLPFTSTPIASVERAGFDSDESVRSAESCADAEAVLEDPSLVAANGYPETAELCQLGDAPSLEDLGPWRNTPGDDPLTPADLKGKVVLVDFWTYTCINCVRTLPYLRSWDEQYADDGLVIIGAHTPEFAFERELDNVEDAIDDLDVTWPVALDNEYDTWNRFSNRFWPAKYLIDRDGQVRYVHYGEGEYDRTEEHIRTLLALDDGEARAEAEGVIERGDVATPETYLGYQRADRFVGRAEGTPNIGSGFATDADATYVQVPERLSPNEWSLLGDWRVEDERSIATGDDSRLRIRYASKEVYLVLAPGAGGATRVGVTVNGEARDPVLVDGNRLYTVASDDVFGERELELEIPDGVEAYAFTFG